MAEENYMYIRLLFFTLFLASNAFADASKINSFTREILNKLDVGDVFSINFKYKDEDKPWEQSCDGVMLPPMPGLTRCPSTYGQVPLSLNKNHKYEVEEVVTSIPNIKGFANLNNQLFAKSELPSFQRERILKLKRSMPAQESTEGVFWYINTQNGAI